MMWNGILLIVLTKKNKTYQISELCYALQNYFDDSQLLKIKKINVVTIFKYSVENWAINIIWMF
jgi:hypothetical protein